MAISRSLMNRQLQADGGIMQVAPREKFGLGSKLKKFVRKIIPNEVAEIATKAAPFVAPFNPAVAAAMSGLGTFDQTGSIGQSLKGGALTYGLGQGARYLGGADFQGNPFSADGGAFRGGLEGLKGGFSSPLGNQTGFKLGQPIEEVQSVGIDTSVPLKKPTAIDGSIDMVTGGSAMDSFKSIVSFDTSAGQKTDAALDLLKRGSKALFYKPGPDGKPILDKAAVLGAATAATTYAEALALAKDTGVEITEEEYDEAKQTDKQEEYAGYLQNFFGGKKDGGRIGFKKGSPEESSEIGIMAIDVEAGDDENEEDMMMAGGITFSSAEKSYLFKRLGGAGGSDRSYTMPSLYRILSNPNRYPEDARILKEIVTINLPGGKKDGGRIGLKDGTGSSSGSGSSNRVAQLMLTRSSLLANDPDEDVSFIDIELERDFGIKMKAEGGIMEAKIPTGKMRKNNAGVTERDYRDEGGFVPVGIKERADDVPAMLSKNEFVMTADAVRGIGNGSVEEGSKKLYNTMKKAEQVGKA